MIYNIFNILDLQQQILVSSSKLTINLLTNEKFDLKTFLFCLRNKDTRLPS